MVCIGGVMVCIEAVRLRSDSTPGRFFFGPGMDFCEPNPLAPDRSSGVIWTHPTAKISQKMLFEAAGGSSELFSCSSSRLVPG